MSDAESFKNMSPIEQASVVVVGAVVFSAVATAATWHRLLGWLVDHDVLVPAQHATVSIPYGDGVGLDAPRIAIALALAALTLITGVAAVRQRLEAAREEAK